MWLGIIERKRKKSVSKYSKTMKKAKVYNNRAAETKKCNYLGLLVS